jgi:LysR family transcriptional regulator for bpeEF and oprC
MDRVTELTAFVRVVEAGSFARAADAMRIPRASLTRLVQSLETRLHVKLLQRSTRSFKVTPDGAAFYQRTVELLAHFEEVESSAKNTTVKLSGVIKVDLSASLGTSVIVPALADFYERFPDLRVELGIGNADVDLLAHGVDCAIRIGTIRDESLVARKIGHVRFLTCGAPALVERWGMPTHASDLDHPDRLLGFISMRTGKPVAFTFAKGSEIIVIEPTWRLLVNETNAYVAAAVAGLGFIQTPAFAVKAAIEHGQLVTLLEPWGDVGAPVHIVYPANRFISARVRAFIDWSLERLSQDAHFKGPATAASPK